MKTLVDDEPDADSIAPMEIEERPIVPVLYCAFCKWGDEEVGPQKRKYAFSQPDSLGRHVRAQHLKNQTGGFDCPYHGCSVFLGSAEHFLIKSYTTSAWVAPLIISFRGYIISENYLRLSSLNILFPLRQARPSENTTNILVD